MMKVSFALAAAIAVIAAMFVPTWNVRAQSAPRFEYARIVPYTFVDNSLGRAIRLRLAFRACVAEVTEWKCRDFEPKESPHDSLRVALATLGDEGWELVSAVDETPGSSDTGDLTYLFKRPLR